MILLLGGLRAIVDDIANAQHHLNVQFILILDNPVGLAVHYLGIVLGFILRVRQDDDGKVLSFKDSGNTQQKHEEQTQRVQTTKRQHPEPQSKDACVRHLNEGSAEQHEYFLLAVLFTWKPLVLCWLD